MRTTSALKLAAVLMVLVPALLFPRPSLAAPGRFGPTDGVTELGYNSNCPPGDVCMSFTDLMYSVNQLGIFPNIAAYSAPDHYPDVKISDGTCRNTDYLALANIAGYLATSSSVPRPYILDLNSVIFATVTPRTCACDKDPNCYNSSGYNTWYVRSDYQTRLNNFKATAGSNINSSTVWGINLNSEIANQNGAVTDPNTINAIAAAIKALWPGIPVLGGYPTDAALGGGATHQYGMAYAPLGFPTGLNYILTWDYSVTDPNASTYQTMYNDTSYGLKRRLRWFQSLVYVVGTFDQNTAGGCPAVSAINGQRFDLLMRSWCAWALNVDTRSTKTLLPFYWGSLTSGGGQQIINWEKTVCGGTALEPAFVSVANVASTGSSCWQ